MKETFGDFLLALNPEKPGPMAVTNSSITKYPSVFIEGAYSAIRNELQVFFVHARKEFMEIDSQRQSNSLTITNAACLASRATKYSSRQQNSIIYSYRQLNQFAKK